MYQHLPKEKRKKILLLSDDFRTSSGIGTMAKELVVGTCHHFNWVNLGAAMNHPEAGKMLDVSNSVQDFTGVLDAEVRVIPYNGYGDQEVVRKLMDAEKPDAVMIFTDPRYWVWLFDMEREIRSKVPLLYLSIWDSNPAPLWNGSFYESCDALFCISKNTKFITKEILEQRSSVNMVDLDEK